MNVIRCNFVIFGAIFMKFSTKCNTKSDIGKFVKNLGISVSIWEKTGADYWPQICSWKIPEYMNEVSISRQTKPVVPFCNTQSTCMPLFGHFMSIVGWVVVH